jgi:hypothetical protein
VVFPPEGIPLVQQGAYLLDAPNYDSLQLFIRWGDGTAVGTLAGGATLAIENFGGGGTPLCRVHGVFPTFGQGGAPGFVPARVWKTTQRDNVQIRTTQNLARLFNISRGHIIRSLMLKVGTLRTGVTAGIESFNAETTDALANIRVMRGTNKQIRHYIDHRTLRQYDRYTRGIADGVDFFQTGAADNGGFARLDLFSASIIDFAENHDITTALDTTSLVQGPTGDVDLFLQADVISGVANQQARLITQEIRGVPTGLRVG